MHGEPPPTLGAATTRSCEMAARCGARVPTTIGSSCAVRCQVWAAFHLQRRRLLHLQLKEVSFELKKFAGVLRSTSVLQVVRLSSQHPYEILIVKIWL